MSLFYAGPDMLSAEQAVEDLGFAGSPVDPIFSLGPVLTAE
ncbi:hypothetical protein [Celeribacter sp.]